MPTHGQAAFIRRAIDGLLAQSHHPWELVLVDDASPDDTFDRVMPYLEDRRIRYHRLPVRSGLGAALNHGLEAAKGDLIAYLPSDDRWFPEHLASLVAVLAARPDAVLAYSGLRHHYNREAREPLEPDGLQLVQLLHRRTADRWMSEPELVSDLLERLMLDRLRVHGSFVGSGVVTAEWVEHPGQLHRVLREPVGGINTFRRRFGVQHPLRFHTSAGDRIDEVDRYARFRDRPDTPAAGDGLRILLVGELAYNAERVLALEERGHRLFGLWMDDPYWYNTVGPLPFGHVTDATARDPVEAVREVRPDVIYALLNWQAVPFAAAVRRAVPDVPFVWHFKEGPFISIEHGHWADLVALTESADGRIFSSPEMRAWFGTAVPGSDDPLRSIVLDGDLPKADWLDARRTRRLSLDDGEIHTVVPGRPIGLHPETVEALAGEGIHLHFYGDFTHGQWRDWIRRASTLAPRHLHLHPTVGPEGWVTELSRYDAGWLHRFESTNRGDIRKASWDDLNYPARMATLAMAGVPMIQGDNTGSIVATQALGLALGVTVVFRTIPELAARLRDTALMDERREAVDRAQGSFTFDAHADELIAFLRRTIDRTA
jgi:hypothetical protein